MNDLTESEIRLLQHVANGWSNKEIGLMLGYSQISIKKQLIKINRKLNTRNRAHAVAVAICREIITCENINTK